MPIQGINNNVNHPIQADIWTRAENVTSHINQNAGKKEIAPIGAEKEATKTLGPLKTASGGTITYSIHGDTVERSKQSIDYQNSRNAAAMTAAAASTPNTSKITAPPPQATATANTPQPQATVTVKAAPPPQATATVNTAPPPQATATANTTTTPQVTATANTTATAQQTTAATASTAQSPRTTATANANTNNTVSGSVKNSGSSANNIGMEINQAKMLMKEGYSSIQIRDKTGLSSQMINMIKESDAKKITPPVINQLNLVKN